MAARHELTGIPIQHIMEAYLVLRVTHRLVVRVLGIGLGLMLIFVMRICPILRIGRIPMKGQVIVLR